MNSMFKVIGWDECLSMEHSSLVIGYIGFFRQNFQKLNGVIYFRLKTKISPSPIF